MKFKKTILGLGLIASLVPLNLLAQEKKVEVLHWWTSGGEAAGVAVIKKAVEAKGVSWQDMPVAGGSGTNAMTVLRSRVAAGNPPTAAQLLGFDLRDWEQQGVLADLNSLAAQGGWDKVVPVALQNFSKYNGQWMAVPVNVHSTNWVWANKEIFDKLKIGPLKTWEDFVVAVNKLKAANITPIAHGGQPWQDTTVFEALVLGIDKGKTYKNAFIELKEADLSSLNIQKAFDRLRFIQQNLDPNFSGRDWNLATNMVITGKAGMQIMGDWAKGEFVNAKKTPGKDYLCFRFPDTKGLVTFNADQFAMFNLSEDQRANQAVLANAVMDKDVQAKFNQMKGSVPARIDVSNKGFDACGIEGMKDLRQANTNGTLLGSVAHGYAVPANIKNAIFDVVTKFVNDPKLSSKQAADQLAQAVQNAK